MDKAGYYIALEGVTRYGLIEAVRNILRGALNHAFFPSPPELRMQCDKAMEWHRQKAADERRRQRENEEFKRQGLYKPINRTAEERERHIARYQEFCRSYDTDSKRREEIERAEIRARYGMTDEAIASIADKPNAWEQIAIPSAKIAPRKRTTDNSAA